MSKDHRSQLGDISENAPLVDAELQRGYDGTQEALSSRQQHSERSADHQIHVGSSLMHFGETVAEAVVGTGEHVVEAVAEVVLEVKDVAVEVVGDLQGTLEQVVVMEEVAPEDNAFHLLEMNLIRSTSILPEDIVSVATTTRVIPPTAADGPDAKPALHRDIPTSTPFTAYLTLAIAIIGLSSIGPLLDLQDGVDGTIKIVWRKSATAVFLFPFAVRSIRRDGFPTLSKPHIINLLLAAGTYASMTVFFAWSLDYTTVGNAVILSNTQAILLLIGKAIMGDTVTLAEGSGALIAFSGAVFCSRDSVDLATGTDTENTTLIGDAYALLSAIAGVAYLVAAKAVRPQMDLYVFMFCIMTIGGLFALLYACIPRATFSWDMDVYHGVFGWLNWRYDRLAVEILMMLCCNILGAMGYVRCMHYFSNVVISVAALLEPVVAELTAVLLGVGDLPGWQGWLGNLLVLAGTFTVVYKPPRAAKREGDGLH